MHQKCFINAYPWVNPHTHIWAYMPLHMTIPPGSPTEYSMETYSILQQVNFQGIRCVTYTLWLRELLISQMWHLSKTGTKHFGNISCMIVYMFNATVTLMYQFRAMMIKFKCMFFFLVNYNFQRNFLPKAGHFRKYDL